MAENKVPAGNSVALPQFPVMRPADGANTSQVRMGGMGPVFPACPTGGSKVRLGGMGQIFPTVIADAGKVRLGGMGPLV